MRISFSACKPTLTQPLVNFPVGLINMDQLIIPRQRRKDKVIVVVGATGTGKSRLSIDLAARFDAEIINSDKMQVYKGLDIVTNKVTEAECCGIPHHLLGFVDPNQDFSAADFIDHATAAANEITNRGRLPIIAGGSNSYIKALVNDGMDFRSKYECCFLWVDVLMPVLNSFVSDRVDQMVAAGLVAEAREFFEPDGDYSQGIRRAIGVPEMDEFFRSTDYDAPERARILASAIDQIKENTRTLASRQRKKILRLEEQLELRMHRLNATEAFLKRGGESDESWERHVSGPSTRIVDRFMREECMDFVPAITAPRPVATTILGPTNTSTAVAAATR